MTITMITYMVDHINCFYSWLADRKGICL